MAKGSAKINNTTLNKKDNKGSIIDAVTAKGAADTPEQSINYIKRSVSIHLELDAAINEEVKAAKRRGERVSRSSIIDAALRKHFVK